MSDGRKSILHVEDDFSLQRLVRASLERLGGYAVHTAASGNQALELASAFAPDLFLLDLDLPGLDGVQTLLALRELAGLAGVPAVFLSADSSPDMKHRLLSIGAKRVLAKPFRPRELVEIVSSTLERCPP